MTHPDWCDHIGYEYQNGNIQQSKTEVYEAYELLAYKNRELYRQIPVPVEYVSHDPYDDYHDMATSVGRDRLLKVWNGGKPPALLSHEDNLKGRAVHDWHGHLSLDCDFSPKGEFTKWYHMCDHYPDSVTQVLFAEVVGQVAVVHHSGWEKLEQKAIAAPSSWIQEVCQYYDREPPSGYDYHDSRNLGKLTQL